MKRRLLVPGIVAAAVISILVSLPAVSSAAIVKCEPQGGVNPVHPVTYWYDVDPQNPFT
jgi:hypothetical protein